VQVLGSPNTNQRKLGWGTQNGTGSGQDRFNRIVDQRWLSQSGSSTTTLDRFQYNYDPDSNPLYKDNLVNSSFSELYHTNGTNAANNYDGLNRLTDFRRGTLSDVNSDGVKDTVSTLNTLTGSQKNWSLDSVGNFNSVTTDGGSPAARGSNLQNQATNVAGVTLTFDKAGNTTKDETSKTFTYDAWNRLITTKNSGGTTIQTYTYDGLGRRDKENSGTSNDLYYSAAWQVLEEDPNTFCGGVQVNRSQYVWSPFYQDELILRDKDVDFTTLDGSLDTTFGASAGSTGFGSTGKITTDFSGSQDIARAVQLQGDGKAVVAGYADVSGGSGSFDYDFAIARYTTAGVLDTTFGTGGKTTVGFGTLGDQAYAEAIQSDGKILVAGQSGNNIALIRLTATGALDTTFDTDGKVTTPFGTGSDFAIGYAVEIDSSGKIVVGGYTHIAADGHYEFAVARYNSDGSLDTTFSSDGKATLYDSSTPLDDVAFAMALQDDGKIVVGGQSNGNFALGCFNSDGTIYTTFGTSSNGIATKDLGSTERINALITQSDGSIVAGGITGSDFAIIKYDEDGKLVTAFGTGGYTTTNLGGSDAAYALARQADGKFIAAGIANGIDFGVVRYTSSGILDTTFNSTGKVTTDFVGGPDTAYALAIGPDYKVTAAGASACVAHEDFAVSRYVISSGLEQRIYAQTDGNHNITSLANVFGSVLQRYVYDPNGSWNRESNRGSGRAANLGPPGFKE
jgi:uncharacterized delta-60 repeat protein